MFRLASVFLLGVLTMSLTAGTFDSAGVTLHYDRVGRGQPVVLLSGGPGFAPDYLEPIAERFAGRYAFVLLHQRGTGRSVLPKIDATTIELKSVASDLEALRRHLGVEKLTIVGHSWGGVLSMLYASQYPDRIAALALVGSGGPTLQSTPKFITNLAARLSEEDNERIREWSDPERVAEDRQQAVLELTRARTPGYFADRSKAHLMSDRLTKTSFNDEVFWALVGQMSAGLDLRGGLRGFSAPVVVIHGRQDPLESAEEVHQTFEGSRLEMIDDAGHFPWFEQPDRFYAILGEFLDQVLSTERAE